MSEADTMELSEGDAVILAVSMANAISEVELHEDAVVFIWQANAAEQIEAALAELGYRLQKILPDSDAP